MKCPYCASEENKVVDKRDSNNGGETRRRRECLDCKKRFTTYEKVEDVFLSVLKKDGSKEAYDRAKLMLGIQKACEKRPISEEELNGFVDEVESELLKMESSEIESRTIGKTVMKKLKNFDDVAYIRFASVCNEFENARSFAEEVSRLKKSST